MKKLLLLLFLVKMMNCLSAQTPNSSTDLVFISSNEVQPKWCEGTNDEFVQLVTSRIKYPNNQCLEGRSILQFGIDTLGQVFDPKIIRSLSKDIDIQLLGEIVKYEFEPGTQRGKKVEVLYTIPIKVCLVE